MDESRHKKDMAGRLSLMQRTMLLWNRLHPYNAVHVGRVARPLDVPRLTAIINDHLDALGLTGLEIDADERRYQYTGGPAHVTVKVIGGGACPRMAVDREVQAQLNDPFPVHERSTPFRFFAVPEDDGFHLGAAYCHFVTDGTQMAALLNHITRSYAGSGARRPTRRLDLYPRLSRSLWPIALRNAAGWLLTFPEFVANMRRSTKPRYADRGDHTNGFASFHVERADLDRLAATARRWGATLNDVFLAALVKSLLPLAATRVLSPRRSKIAVSSIADIRKDLEPRAARQFGVCLGNFTVFQPVLKAARLERIARGVRRQTVVIKRHRLYLRVLVDLAVGLWVMPLGSRDRQQKAYRQYYPLWGGITNVNLDRVARPRPITGYVRAVSTGPVCPLVVALTTYGGALNVGVTFRTTVYSEPAIRDVIAGFQRCVTDPANA